MDNHKENNTQQNRESCCQPQPLNTISEQSVSDVQPSLNHPWIVNALDKSFTKIPVVSTILSIADKLGSWKARWAFGRMKYKVDPGLYAVGNPIETSPVFVSANYKMSFDRLRSELGGIDGWILVLDTKGINVWCAAGKGTFGTEEIVNRIRVTGLKEIISHRKLIIPQLGAPGISAHIVKEQSGFRVVYGPVRAEDIPAFLDARMKATPEMRRVRFSLKDRIVLIPTDLMILLKYAIPAAAVLLLLSGFGADLYSFDRVRSFGITSALVLLIAGILGTVLSPALLPWLPGRSFSIKGMWVGLLLSAGVIWIAAAYPELFRSTFVMIAWICIITAISSFMAMNFTGSSTYTSLSGVRKEMKIAVPLQIIFAVSGIGLWITGLFV
jgi:CO dehydrogenase/acetyl-CoA synthase delta subunit